MVWVSNSEIPFHTSELFRALGVRTGPVDLDPENIPKIRAILGSLGLILVDAFSSTIRLFHFALQEYSSCNPSLFQNPHPMIAEVCFQYLNFMCVLELSPARGLAQSRHSLVDYASCYWGKRTRREKTESATPLALRHPV